MKHIISIILTLWSVASFGTQVEWKSIDEITKEADHVFVGKITKIDYKDENGTIMDEGSTGPGCDAEIRVHIQVDHSQILKTNAQTFPDSLIVPFWNRFHYSVRQFKSWENHSFVFCLKGDSFERVYPAHWLYDLNYKEDIQMSITGEPAQAELTGVLRKETSGDEMGEKLVSYFLKTDGQKQIIELRGEFAAETLWNMDGKRIWVKGHLLTEQNQKKSWGSTKTYWNYFMVVREVKEVSTEFEIPKEGK